MSPSYSYVCENAFLAMREMDELPWIRAGKQLASPLAHLTVLGMFGLVRTKRAGNSRAVLYEFLLK